MSDIRKEFSDVIYPTMVIRSQAETIELQEQEIERLNNIIEEIKKLCDENTNGIDDDGYDDAYYDRVYVREIDEIIDKYELKGDNK